MTKTIALIHATRAAIGPIEDAFRVDWPEAEVWNLMDEGLAQEIDRSGGLNEVLSDRLNRLADYAASADCNGILFSCAAYGPAIDRAKNRHSIPVLKPNEALIDEIMAQTGPIALLATHPPALPTIEAQVAAATEAEGAHVALRPRLVAGAWAALQAGNQDAHDAAVLEAVAEIDACGCIALAQFSLASLASRISERSDATVLSGPTLAVRRLRAILSD